MESALGAPRRRPGTINKTPLVGWVPSVAGPHMPYCERVEPALTTATENMATHRRVTTIDSTGRRPLCGINLLQPIYYGSAPLLWQIHLAQERSVAGVRLEVLKQREPLHVDEVEVVCLIRAIEP
jgi:hypothetical protein